MHTVWNDFAGSGSGHEWNMRITTYDPPLSILPAGSFVLARKKPMLLEKAKEGGDHSTVINSSRDGLCVAPACFLARPFLSRGGTTLVPRYL